MQDFIKEIIVDPVTKEPLLYDAENQIFTNEKNGNTYPCNDGLPVFLMNKKSEVSHPVGYNFPHNFDYSTHYQIDGEVFNYEDDHASAMTNFEIEKLHQTLISKVPENAQTFLDVGCGNGWLAEQFVPKNKNVVSMDIGTTNPLKALQRFPQNNHAALVADVYQMPFSKDVFDCIIASEVLEHVVDPKQCISRLLDVLKPGGKILISTPFNEKIEYSLCVHCNKLTPKNAHLHSFNKHNIRDYLPAGDYKIRLSLSGNKILLRLRTHLIFKYLPYKLWRLKDSIYNYIFPHAERLILEIESKQE